MLRPPSLPAVISPQRIRIHFLVRCVALFFLIECATVRLCAPASSSPKETILRSESGGRTKTETLAHSLVESFTELPLKQKVYTGTQGIPLSFGSGLTFLTNSRGTLVFLGLTDRGPNIAAPEDLSLPTTYLLLERAFAPSLFPFVLDGDEITPITWSSLQARYGSNNRSEPQSAMSYGAPLLDSAGEPFDGIPPADSGQISTTAALAVIEPTGKGIDPEGITILPELDQIWISEEYGPSILTFSLSTRRLLKRLDPGHGLPEIVSKRKMNRGFEAIASFKDGSVVAALQSPLSVDGFKKDCLPFVFISPQGTTTTAGMSLKELIQLSDYKLSDLATVEKNVLIGVESFEDTEGRNFKNLIVITLSSDGKNSIPTCDSSLSTYSVKREKLLDMSVFGKRFGKIEGLTLLPDKKTLLFTEDTDFGVQLKKKGKKGSDISIPGSSQFLSTKDIQTKVYRIVFRDELVS